MRKTLLAGLVAGLLTGGAQAAFLDSETPGVSLLPGGVYESGLFDESAAEISAYDANTRRLFVTNAKANTLDVLDLTNPRKLQSLGVIDLSPYGGGVNSVAVHNGVVAVAMEAEDKTAPGSLVLLDTNGGLINRLTVGALPDMAAFTPDGRYVLVANEGEPNDAYTVDPEGSVSIIDLSAGAAAATQADVRTAGFSAFNEAEIDPSIRIFGPGASVAQDLEPEYIAISADSATAWVVLQENNALAIIDIANATVTDLKGLGYKDHSVIQNALDASNKDNGINLTTWPIWGLYMPDAIASYSYQGETYLVTANEGDARDYDGYSEEVRVKDLTLDPVSFPDAAELQREENLGRLKTTTAHGDIDGDGEHEIIYSYGARSFAIWNQAGELVYDSGSDFERLLADIIPADFNATNDENASFDNRSDDKGPEPEGVTVGQVGERTFAFIGLERVGGIMIYDITTPFAPRFVRYVTTRDFSGDAAAGTAGNLGPEGLLFIPKAQSPAPIPLLIVTNEVSGTTQVFGVMPD